MVDYDIIIIGGGPSGIGAAIAAAKLGLKTAIIERSMLLGGNWTNGYVLSILGVYTYNGSQKITGGVVDEIIDALKEHGGTIGKSGNFIPFRPDEMKLTLSFLSAKYKINLFMGSILSDVKLGNGIIDSITIFGKDGFRTLSAKFFIDGSGDADLAYLANLDVLEGKEYTGGHQSATIPFRIGNVNEEEVIRLSKELPNVISITLRGDKLERIRVMPPLVEKAKNSGKLYLPNDSTEFLFNTGRKGEFVCNSTHIKIKDFRSGVEIAEALIDLRRQVFSSFNFLVNFVSGFKDAYIIDSAPGIGFRETRRAIGEYVLKKSDVLGNARFEDAIARCGHPIEIHDPERGVMYIHLEGGDSSWYHIPYRAIVMKGLGNAFVIGRCLSAEFEAQASARVTGTAIAMGQAAATAAYLCIIDNRHAMDVNIKSLQSKLREHGMII